MSLWKQLSKPKDPTPEISDDISSNDEIDPATLTAEEKHLYMLDEFNDLFENSDEDEYYYCQSCKLKFKTEEEAMAHQETPEHFATEEAWQAERAEFVKELKAERDEHHRQRKEEKARRKMRTERTTAAKREKMREWREKKHAVKDKGSHRD